MNAEAKLNLIKQVGEEIITEDGLKQLLETKKNPIAYDGFEPSGTNVHIAQGLLRAININKMTKVGCKFKMLVADWHAWANNKMDGNLEHIQKVGKYLIEVWKACDMDIKNVEFVWGNELMKSQDYLKIVMQVARNSTVKRITRCSQIMGRSESDVLQASQIFYPCMQAADIFYLDADITQLGMDQRKVNVLAREIAPKLNFKKPIVVSHHMLMGLGNPPKGEKTAERAVEIKMSKSNPDSAIFMDDNEDDIKRKLNKAYCPEGVIEENPVLEYNKYIIFEKFKSIKIERAEKFGGNLEFNSYEELEKEFLQKKLHPMDLKQTTSIYLNKLIEPVRNKLKTSKTAEKLAKEIKSFKVTK
ncbi:MAG: tyrosine--tRNA ligase [Candidatus Woesearchaeota archaeon]|jgi:tyrosyl-tRNA synthetase|nr:tyrosine--tRNA ligase [Candidatus Woesearchaeota archaeon]MDP7622986.1 tyrosine--tRNA ligase [Candidatus Woesearchaeota archaeon]HJN56383.1 tyrosine--tRNA ligase [Candidatus Woesearchaeota archaeon]